MRETSDPTATPPAGGEPSALARRLLRRASAPLGAIDTRPAQARFERAQEWSRRHLALVEAHLGRAHAAVEGDSAALVLADRTVVEAQPDTGAGIPTGMAANTTVPGVADSPPRAQPPAPDGTSFERSATASEGGPSASAPEAVNPPVSAPPGAAPARARGGSSPAEAAPAAGAAPRAVAPGSVVLVQRKVVAAGSDGVAVPGRAPVSMPLVHAAPPSGPRARREDRATPATSASRAGEAAPVASRGAGQPPVKRTLSEAAHTADAPSLELARPAAARPPSSAAANDDRPGRVDSPPAQERATSSPSGPAESGASAAVALAGGASAEPGAAPPPLRAVAGAARDAAWPEMVWRHGAEPSAATSSGGRPGQDASRFSGLRARGATAEAASAASALAAVSAPAPVAEAAVAGAAPLASGTGFVPAAPNVPAPSSASSVDVGRLAEQVTRIILRQAVVERERRGGG